MKVTVHKLDEAIVRVTHPITTDRAPGWFFRCEEGSNNGWHANGMDLWGRTVSGSDWDYDRLLRYVFDSAAEICAQLAGRGE
jgi:hypothetical protein